MIDTQFNVIPNLYNTLCKIEKDCLELNLGDSFDEHIANILHLKKLGRGSSRNTYLLNDRYVLKVPNTRYQIHNGIEANLTEFLIYKRFKKVLPLAPCKLFFFESIPVLVMKRLELYTGPERMKSLGGFCDGYYQLGKTKSNKILCYDYGYEFTYAKETLGAAFDLTPSEMKVILSKKPNLYKCPHVLFPQFQALTIK